jgi:hypothetical protein
MQFIMNSAVIKALPQPLDQRPEATALKLEDLMAEVRRGRLRIPSFQRPFQWVRKDALKLLDSIYRGYPIGTLLLWSTDAEAGVTKFGSVVIAGGARQDAWWVVDGQQRVVSLVRTLLATAAQADDFALYFDLDEGRLVPPQKPATDLDAARWLPMTEVVDSERLMRWVFLHAREHEWRRDRAFDFGKRVREYPIPAYVVRADSDGPLREIFGRINHSGKPMKASEVFDALNGVRSSSRPASIEQIADELGQMQFGRLDEKIIYRLLRVLQGADVVDRTSDLPERLGDDEAGLLYARTVAAAKRSVEFLENDAGIAHWALLPYKQPLVALGKFFDLHPQASHRSRELLARWIWRGALNGTHRGDTVSTRRVLDAIDGDEDKSIQRLLEGSGGRPAQLPDATSPFNFRHAESKLETLALLDLSPRDLSSMQPLAAHNLFDGIDGSDGLLLPHIFSPTRGQVGQAEASVANRLAHPRRSNVRKTLFETARRSRRFEVEGVLLLQQLERILLDPLLQSTHAANTDADSVLAESLQLLSSHGFDEAESLALAASQHRSFLVGNEQILEARRAVLERRQQYLRGCFQAFFDRRARWDDNDRPPIAALIADVEEA